MDNKYIRNFHLFISGVILIIFYGIRFDAGRDYNTYEIIFNKIHNLKSVGEGYVGLEKGYLLLNSISRDLGFNFQIVIFIQTFFLIGVFIWLISKYSKNYVISILVLLLLINIYSGILSGIVRQGFAVGFFLMSIPFIIKRSLKLFLLTILFGAFFHISIVLTIPLYFVLMKEYRKRIYMTLFLLTLLIYAINRIQNLFLLALSISGISSGYLSERYLRFFEPMNLGSHLFILLLIGIFFLLFCNKEKIINDKNDLFFVNLTFFSSLVSILMLSTTLFSRIEYYLFFGNVILFSYLLRIFAKESKILVYCSVVILSLILTGSVLYLLGEERNLLPYKFRLNFFKEL
ncbi:EpsG family protein [Leeuwenhoekiella sp. A16]|uniref:EpsG family protein n=1 Tax=unclassified Leeuwenhoekiella TaxID=2615029 RepID=UPI003A812DB4